MSTRSNVVIVGGGVIGLTTAYVLARRGVPSIVLDQNDLGREASWAGAGILPPADEAHAVTPMDRLRSYSVSRLADFSAELRERTGIDNGYRRCGALVFPDDVHVAADDEWHSAGARRFDVANPTEIEPSISPNLGAAVNLPDMAQIRNPRHLDALIAATQSLVAPDGWPLVDLRPGEAVVRVLTEGQRVVAVSTTRGVVDGERFLLAAGAWTPRVLQSLGWTLPIEPVRGQIVLLNPGWPILRTILARGSRYLVPRAEGRVLIGSTEEFAGFHKATTASGVQGLLELASQLVPDLAGATVECTWAGLRPGSRDGLPYLGRVGDFDNLFIAAGHFRAGLQLSLGTGLLMADLLTGETPAIDVAPFAPDRHGTPL